MVLLSFRHFQRLTEFVSTEHQVQDEKLYDGVYGRVACIAARAVGEFRRPTRGDWGNRRGRRRDREYELARRIARAELLPWHHPPFTQGAH